MARRVLWLAAMTASTAHESALLWLRDDPSRLSALLVLTGHAPCPGTLAADAGVHGEPHKR